MKENSQNAFTKDFAILFSLSSDSFKALATARISDTLSGSTLATRLWVKGQRP